MEVVYIPQNMQEAIHVDRRQWANPLQAYTVNESIVYHGRNVRGKYNDPDKLPEDVSFCFDVGQCNLVGQNMYDYIVGLGKRLKAVVLRDNNGFQDVAMLPFTCCNQGRSMTDWLGIIRGLRAIDFDGTIIIDFSDSVLAMPHQLKKQCFMLAKEIGNYFVWQLSMERTIRKYDKRVLFGAGNMCRNYMKCYGEAYPPLFTCDNNEKIWGTTFEGLEIKSPKVLKELPPDCAVLICNMYYDEIEQQLRDLGIQNPIERFNDEYLPSMYTDRFDAQKREVRS